MAEDSVSANLPQNSSFEPVVSKPSWVDMNDNGIADSLDREILEKTANGTAQDHVAVTVLLKSEPTEEDANDFVQCGGYLTTSAWREATYGFGGLTTYEEIVNFTHECPNLLLVEKEATGTADIAYAAQQVGARTYVWNTVGLQGDPATSIAMLDTGISASHVDFQPGYGDENFSKKIVGWDDEIGHATSPVDDNGHGSHVAGLAAGNGFFTVDASGNAIATWGTDLGSISSSGTFLVSGIPVNKAGTIEINVKWGSTGSASLSALTLISGDKNLNSGTWTPVASVNTPSQNTFYPLTYNVETAPSDGYDMYHFASSITQGSGNLYVALTISWPYTPPSDGFQAWTGIAPQSKLVGIKVMNSLGSGSSNELINGINWVIANRMAYHITVASMSLGFSTEVTSVDLATRNLINSGVTVVVAAGNEGSGSNRVFSCGSVDEVITVAAMNEFDSVTEYSSQGGISRYTGRTIKPDITAPGGSFLALPIFSADSNGNDAEGRFTEIQPDDAAPLQGTSMATPIISGCAQIVIQAMGGYSAWNWTRTQALQPKMILLMTATETYPNLREDNTSTASPTLERGNKDIHEGYGRVNLDAAIDALVKPYAIGSTVTDTLGQPPTTTDTSTVGQKLAWARNVQLTSDKNYSFSLTVPAGADYDLYLYNALGTNYGEPAIVTKSTNPTTGGTEQLEVTAPYTGTYYLVVKRATENTGSGDFTLSSSGPEGTVVTLNTPGLQTAFNVVHYTENGIAKNGSIISNTFSANVDLNTTLTIDNPIYISDTQRFLTTDTTSFAIESNAAFTVSYQNQYYIEVDSAHGVPTNSQWIDQGSSFTVTVTSPADVVAEDHRWICTGFSLDGGASQSGTSYTFSNVTAEHLLSFNWKEQFYLAVNSAYSAPTGAGYYDSGTTATPALSNTTISGRTGVRHVFTGWSGDAAGVNSTSEAITMNTPKTATANWRTQYYLTASANFGSVTPDSGWYDSGSNFTILPTAPPAASGERYVWSNWTGTGPESYTGNNPQASITLNGPTNESAFWTHQYMLTVNSAHDLPDPKTGWFDAGTPIQASVTSPVKGTIFNEYTCSGWTGTGSVPELGRATTMLFTINQPSTITWSWETTYLLAPLLTVIVVPSVLIILAVYLLRRRKWKRNVTEGEPASKEQYDQPA